MYGIIVEVTTLNKFWRHVETTKEHVTSDANTMAAALAEAHLPYLLAVGRSIESYKIMSIEDITLLPMWNNCVYSAGSLGHSEGFCTADSCY